MVEPDIWPVAVAGAGAAGLLAAIFAARGGARVLLLETRPRPGAKIRVSGGGRCNVLPSEARLEDFHTSGSVHALRNILLSWPLPEVRAFFESDLGIPLQVESTGKLFPRSNRAQDVIEALLREAARTGVQLRSDFRVVQLRRLDSAGAARFELRGAGGERVACTRLVLATGGLSLPKTGSDGGGLEMARQLGLEIVPTYPALVPLLTSEPGWTELAGISLPVRLRAQRGDHLLEERHGDFLFTHRGFSGPVVLDLSRHWSAPQPHPEAPPISLRAQWGSGDAGSWESSLRHLGRQHVATLLRQQLPRRLADLLLGQAAVPTDRRGSELTRPERQRLVTLLESCALPIAGDEGYRTAEVTGGGVALADLVTATLECRKVPGLYLAGEILDAVGRIGGYNFLWAWVTGRKAGLAIASTMTEQAPER